MAKPIKEKPIPKLVGLLYIEKFKDTEELCLFGTIIDINQTKKANKIKGEPFAITETGIIPYNKKIPKRTVIYSPYMWLIGRNIEDKLIEDIKTKLSDPMFTGIKLTIHTVGAKDISKLRTITNTCVMSEGYPGFSKPNYRNTYQGEFLTSIEELKTNGIVLDTDSNINKARLAPKTLSTVQEIMYNTCMPIEHVTVLSNGNDVVFGIIDDGATMGLYLYNEETVKEYPLLFGVLKFLKEEFSPGILFNINLKALNGLKVRILYALAGRLTSNKTEVYKRFKNPIVSIGGIVIAMANITDRLAIIHFDKIVGYAHAATYPKYKVITDILDDIPKLVANGIDVKVNGVKYIATIGVDIPSRLIRNSKSIGLKEVRVTVTRPNTSTPSLGYTILKYTEGTVVTANPFASQIV